MAMLIKDRDTTRRDGRLFDLPLAAGARVFAGGIVCLGAGGFAVPASAAAGLRFPCLATEGVNNSGGDGAVSVAGERTVVGLDYEADVTRAQIGQTVYLADDHTVTAAAAGKSPAGLLVDIQDGQAWIDLARA
ncbi:MAG: hypothetical protein FWG97_03925 [Deltaproteobacteria bacterium]|nr:hypothetical protein [Deltaproteobacteria bacterium]